MRYHSTWETTDIDPRRKPIPRTYKHDYDRTVSSAPSAVFDPETSSPVVSQPHHPCLYLGELVMYKSRAWKLLAEFYAKPRSTSSEASSLDPNLDTPSPLIRPQLVISHG